GGGGAPLGDDAAVAARAKHLTTTAKTDPIEFFHDEVGYNYRLTNIAAAVGVAQLEDLEPYIEAKRDIARQYRTAFAHQPGVVVHPEPPHCRSTFWMFTLRLDRHALPRVDRLDQRGVTA